MRIGSFNPVATRTPQQPSRSNPFYNNFNLTFTACAADSFKGKKIIKVLSLPGGGTKGVVSATILAKMKELTGKEPNEIFDFSVGTSTGGIITSLLNKPNPLSAKDIVEMYTGRGGRRIFEKNPLRFISSLFTGSKYSNEGMEAVFSELFGDACLKDALKPICITSYNTELNKLVLLSSYNSQCKGIKFKDAAEAGASAPTYFPPVKLQGHGPFKGTFIDACLVTDNPGPLAYIEGHKLLKRSGIDPNSKEIVIVSPGTGLPNQSYPYEQLKKLGPVGWVQKSLVPILVAGSNNIADRELRQLLKPENYYPFQLPLPKKLDKMDNTKPDDLKELIDLTLYYIENDWAPQFKKLCEFLTSSTKKLDLKEV